GLLLVTGLLMVYVGELSLATTWILLALALFVLVVLIGLFGYTPTLREQIRLVESAGPGPPRHDARHHPGGAGGRGPLPFGRQAGLLTAAAWGPGCDSCVAMPAQWGLQRPAPPRRGGATGRRQPCAGIGRGGSLGRPFDRPVPEPGRQHDQ